MFDFNGTLLLVFISFFIYMLIMKPLFFDRLMRILNEREAVINTAENKANDVAEKFKQLEAKTHQKLVDAHHQSQLTVREATATARTKACEIRDKAEQHAKDHVLQVITALHHSTKACYEELSPQRNEWAKAIIERLKSKEGCKLL